VDGYQLAFIVAIALTLVAVIVGAIMLRAPSMEALGHPE
jgi:hypothetical protein